MNKIVKDILDEIIEKVVKPRVYTFKLDPKNHKPTGRVNLSQINSTTSNFEPGELTMMCKMFDSLFKLNDALCEDEDDKINALSYE